MNGSQGRGETLGAFLARVRPGDRCACCGDVMQSLDLGGRLGRVIAAGGSAGRPGEAVACAECGCEICEEADAGPENMRRLVPAA